MALLCGAAGQIIWGFSFLLLRMAQQVSSPELLLSVRFLLAVHLMTVPVLLGKKRISFHGRRPASVFLLGALETAYFFFESYGILYTNATFAGVVLAVSPVLSIIFSSSYLKEYPTRRQAFFCILPVAGVIIMTVSGSSLGIITPLGLVSLCFSVTLSAVCKVVNRKASAEFSSFERTYFMLLFSAVGFTVSALINAGGLSAFSAECVRALSAPAFLWPMLALVFFCSIGSNLLVNYAAGKLSVARVSSLSSLTTLVSMLAGIVFLKEPCSPSFFLGAFLIVAGIWQVTRPDDPACFSDEEKNPPANQFPTDHQG